MADRTAASASSGAAALPSRVHLPSGAVVHLSDARARSAIRDVVARGLPPVVREIELCAAPGVLAAGDGAPLDPWDLSLSDAHALCALVLHAGLLDEEDGEFFCENCAAPFHASPSSLLEIGPFVDGELDHPEVDAPFDFDVAHAIPRVRVAGGPERWARSVRLAPRTAREARALLDASAARELVLGPTLVRAMGVVAVGRVRRVSDIAGALAGASDDAWGAVVDLWHAAHYASRLVGVVRCEACGARNDLDVPLVRELERMHLAGGADPQDAGGSQPRTARESPRTRARGRFPDLDAFERRVRQIAEDVYARRHVRNVGLYIDAGVPACDEGGEPLLGSYTPGGADESGIAHDPEVRIYYRTFEAEHARGDFDVEGEIRETIDHEIEHHLHHISGTDPLDDEEHAEIDRERIVRVGRRETGRRAARTFTQDLAGFARVAWPLLAVGLVASALAWCS